MKLRLGKNSIRLRVLRSEVEILRAGTRLDETLHFGPKDSEHLTFALESSAGAASTALRFSGNEILVSIAADRLQQWASSEQVGVYDRIDTGQGRTIEILVEKDFACLDRSDAENADTFDNPNLTC